VQSHRPFAADNRLVQSLQSSVCLSCAGRWMGQSNSQFIGGLGLSGTCFPKIASSPLGSSHHVAHCSSGQAHSSSQTASLLYVSQMQCCTMHCQLGRKPQTCPFPLGFRHPAGGGPSHGHRQQAHDGQRSRA